MDYYNFKNMVESGQILENPTKEVFLNHKLVLFINVLYLAFGGAFYYAIFVWFPDYMYDKEINPIKNAYIINSVNMVINLLVEAFAGWVIDKWFDSDPTFSLILFGALSSIFGLCVFPVLETVDAVGMLFIQMAYGILTGAYSGGWSLWAIERFGNNVNVRFSGFAIGYNISSALFGGTAPLIASALLLNNGTWSVGLLLFVEGMISTMTNVICYCFIDRHKDIQHSIILSDNDSGPSEMDPLSEKK